MTIYKGYILRKSGRYMIYKINFLDNTIERIAINRYIPNRDKAKSLVDEDIKSRLGY